MRQLTYASAAGIIIFILLLISVIQHKELKNERLTAANHQLLSELVVSREELSGARETINRQNEAIARHAAVMQQAQAQHETKLKAASAKARETRVRVIKEIEKDPSCENQLRLIKEQQEAFYGTSHY